MNFFNQLSNNKLIFEFLASITFLIFLCKSNLSQNFVEFTSSNLPIFVIDTGGQTIPSDIKINVDLGVIYNGEGERNFLTDPFGHYDGIIGIEIRGSSSQNFPKKSYAFETRDSNGDNLNFPLLGFPAENDWVLYGPYSDKSLLRNVLIYKMFNEMGYYSTRTKYCELVINDEYKGIYVLMEKIKRDNNRVDISRLEPTDTSAADITGGYIIKIDKFDGENNRGWESSFEPFPNAWQKIVYQYHYPKPDEINHVQENYIQYFIYNFEHSIYFNLKTGGSPDYLNYIDFDSVVDYFLINEVAKNLDSYRLSVFMYKDRDDKNGKLFMGPIWDYNIALGNADYYEGGQNDGWEIDYLTNNPEFLSGDNYQVPFYWKKFRHDSLFKSKVYLRWQELKSNVFDIQKIWRDIDSLTMLLDESQERNFQKWPVLGEYVWPNNFVGLTYQDEINYLKNWIAGRIHWIDYNIFGEPSFIEYDETAIPKNYVLHQNFPNPFNPTTTIEYQIPADQNLNSASQHIILKVYDSLGREIATLINEQQEPGRYKKEFDAKRLSSGIYFYNLKTLDFSATKKMVLLN
jgi:hypothetical protein